MGLTVEQVAEEMRVSIDGDAELEAIVARLAGVGEELVALRAPDAPQVVKDEAVVRVAAYLFDQPQAPSASRYASAWRNSGAAALVSPWVVRRLGIVGAAEEEEAST